MPIDPARIEEWEHWLGEGKALIGIMVNVVNRVRTGVLEGDVALTAAQRTALRAYYDTWQNDVLAWWNRRPT